ncbi:hypothetical protein MKW98_005415 [Papaver atlanticum]|uniref:Uncharacterized protein n=1 Tax=Papaver atlanticum TaxID=357466 RepID=A0AAD4X4W1_9MAGN|nr:hypothetical protein MKW98_005415 [Papaver atlanticum]
MECWGIKLLLQRAKCVLTVEKFKKLKTAGAKVMTELDVIQRFKAAGHIGDDKVFPRKEMKNHSASSTGSQTQPTNSSGSYTSSEELDSPPQRAMQLDHRSISPSRTPRNHYSRSSRSSTSYSSSEEEDYPVRRRSRSKADPPRRTSSSTSYSSSQEEDYPIRRRSRYSKADPPQKKTGHVRRFMNKSAGMFHDRLEDTDASSSDHHLSALKPVGNGILRHKSKEKRMQKRRTASVNKPMIFPNTRRKASDAIFECGTYQLQQNLADENEKLVLKGALDNAVTQLVQSHVKVHASNKVFSFL